MAQASSGFIDFLTQHHVAGWTQAQHLQMVCNGDAVGEIWPRLERPDVAAAGIDHAFGFDAALPVPLWIDDVFELRDAQGASLKANPEQSYVPRLLAMTRFVKVEEWVGLEVGPLDKPIVPKGRFSISYADHASRQDLMAIYAASEHGRDVERICEVDFVTSGRLLSAVTAGRTFDYVIASHVAEHVPNLIGWLRDIWSVLKPGGVVVLALPHRDHTFDSKRRTTSFGELLDAHIADLSRPSPRQIADHMLGVHAHFGNDVMANSGSLLRDVFNTAQQSASDEIYTDCHCSVFTPASFIAAWTMLETCGLACFELLSVDDGAEGAVGEFYVHLRRRP